MDRFVDGCEEYRPLLSSRMPAAIAKEGESSERRLPARIAVKALHSLPERLKIGPLQIFTQRACCLFLLGPEAEVRPRLGTLNFRQRLFQGLLVFAIRYAEFASCPAFCGVPGVER